MSVTGRHADGDTVADLPVVVADDGLDEDPFDDDLEERVAALAPRPVTRTTLALVGLVVLVAGFLGGVLVQKSFGRTTGSTNATTNFPGAGAFTGQNSQGRTAAQNITTGTVKLVDGTTVYITLSNGDIVTVRTSNRTTVAARQTVTLKDLKVGQAVSVEGSAGTDGTITATSVTAGR
jgi:Cu/Ag efflux protein CusF